MCYIQKRSFTSVSVKVVDTYRATTQLNKYPLLFTSLFDIGNVSADQDGSRLCSYLPLYFASELVLYLTILTMVWQPKGQPKRPISVWYKHGPTCLVLPKDLTVHMDVELNPGPLQKKPIYLLTCLPTVSGLVSYPGNKLLSTNNADTRQVGICGSYYSDVFHRFSYWPCSSPLSSTYRRCRAGRRVRERKARNIHRIESLVSYPRASRGSDNLHKGSISHNLCVITPANTNNNVSSVTSTNSSLHANSLVNPRSILNFADFNSRSVRNKIETSTTSLKMTTASAPLPRPGWMTLTSSVLLSYLWLAIPSRIFLENGGTGILFRDSLKVSLVDGKKYNPLNFQSGLLKYTIALWDIW